MFAAIKNEKTITTGQSKGQVKRKLCQMGLNFNKYKIVEINEEKTCPVCGGIMKIVPNSCILKIFENIGCFFCRNGIKLN